MTATETAGSWILDLRSRLVRSRDRAPFSGATENVGLTEDDTRVVFFVPLFVQEGQLYTILAQDEPSQPGGLPRVGFPAREASTAEEEWAVAGMAAEEFLRVPPGQVLRIGELSERRGIGGVRYLACVGAIPTPTELPTLELELFRLPILAARTPQALEPRTIEVAGGQEEVQVAMVGDRLIWGPASEILDDLIARLGLGH